MTRKRGSQRHGQHQVARQGRDDAKHGHRGLVHQEQHDVEAEEPEHAGASGCTSCRLHLARRAQCLASQSASLSATHMQRTPFTNMCQERRQP